MTVTVRVNRIFPVLLLVSVCCVSTSTAATDTELLAALDSMYEAPLMSESTLAVSGGVISLRDFQLYLDSGQFIPFEPLELGSAGVHYGGFFRGRGRLLLHAPIAMERQQIDRFFKSDSLNRTFTRALILFNDTLQRQLLKSAQVDAGLDRRKTERLKDELLEVVRTFKSRYFFYQTLTNLSPGQSQPYITAALALDKGGNVVVQCDPTEREEIALFKHEWLPGSGYFFQPICSYSLDADPLAGRYNGIYKGGLTASLYDVDATVWGDGKFTGSVKGTFTVDSVPTQIAYFSLSDEMKVDSVLDSAGAKVSFRQYKKDDSYLGFWLIFKRPLSPGEVLPLTFFYAGDVAERELGIYFVYESEWYPRPRHERARFKMRFRTKKDYEFITTGKLVNRAICGDTLITDWEVTEPTDDVSLNIGLFKKYTFGADGKTPVDILFSEELHRELAASLLSSTVGAGRHMEKQVAGDITASLAIFSHLFGQYPHERITVSEVILPLSVAYPGSLHLSALTWMNTDLWGHDRLHRAHEVAHQWWGAGVGFETYHDQWLSEGFAEYSSFMYLQAVAGNDLFMDRLDDIRKEVLAERKTAGAIALGVRTSNYKEPNHYGVLVYEKGALVLHMLRNLFVDLESMREDRFVNLMKEFYSTYVGKDPSTDDFKRLVEKHAGIDMTWFFDQWVYGDDIPTYNFSYQIKPGADSGKFQAELRIEQRDVPSDFKMYVPLEIEYGPGQKQYVRLFIDRPVIDIPLGLPAKPKKLKLNPFMSVLADVKQ
ncbi:hypothetical protein C3F09_07690 [candidate division GN15 bacterium]|uniref:Peptidase M1 membrane alanine aminopeptidase domain-containing protein n=1 Tax=candidate division GN15 bacterium TaxID=2072418 RepID=A0A855X0P7_9BACT|nr:MAG: hypothetical protein C3F09_07690 [candidate division GN15 bacterium]